VPERLNKHLAAAGLGSRRAVEDLIRAGRVTVNGGPAGLTTTVSPGDEVCVDGRPVAREQLRALLLHKPSGVVTTATDPHGRPTVLDLVPGDVRLFPVGRLDRLTTGALLLTNDGDLANRLAHPRYGVDKTYVAEVVGSVEDEALRLLREGVELDDGMTAPARVTRLAPDTVELVIHEGRNRQVRRMCEAVGHPVRRLHRPVYAGLTLEGLEPGRWRDLDDAEVRRLRDASHDPPPAT
jgi:pseudouridine synthase